MIVILTVVGAFNYGPILQEYALYKVLKDKSVDVKVLNLENPKIVNLYKPFFIDTKSIKGFMKSAVKSCLFGRKLARKNKNFRHFEDEYIELTKEIKSFEELDSLNCTKVIVGSDQVWNFDITGKELTYYFENVPKHIKRYSYAPSFGEYVPKKEDYDRIKNEIEQFDILSVRENSAVDILRKMGVQKDIEVVLDPVLILPQDSWKQVAKTPKESKYILIFLARRSDRIYEEAKKLSEETGLPILDLSHHKIPVKGVKNIGTSGPDEFLGYFREAEYIFTTSFHGVSFSLIFQKQFICDLYSNKGEKNQRAVNLLSKVGLENRFLDIEKPELIKETIDWESAQKKLDIEREKSLAFLEKVVNDEK